MYIELKIQSVMDVINNERNFEGQNGIELDDDDMRILRRQILESDELFDLFFNKITKYIEDVKI